MTVLTDISTPNDRGRVMSIYQGTLLLGSGMGPSVGGLVAEGFGIQAPFFFSSGLGLLATLWAFLRAPETKGISLSGPQHERGPKRALAPGGLRSLLLNANFLLVGLIGFGILFTHTGSQQTIIPLLGYNTLGLGESQIGFAMTVMSIIDFLVIFFGGMAADRFGRKVMIVPAMVVTALGLVLFIQGETYAFYLFSAAVFGVGRGIAGTAPMAYAADIAHEGSHGLASGLYRTFCDIGMMLGPVALGWVADIVDYGTALYVNAGMLLVIALLFGILAQESARRPEAVAAYPAVEE